MPSDPIRERLLAVYKSGLAGITTVAGFHYTVANVYRWVLPAFSALSYPCLVLATGKETVEEKVRLQHRALTLVVQGFHLVQAGTSPEPETVANRVLADIQTRMESSAMEALLRAVPGWTHHEEVSALTMVGYPSDPHAFIESAWTVHYRTRRTDPAEGTP